MDSHSNDGYAHEQPRMKGYCTHRFQYTRETVELHRAHLDELELHYSQSKSLVSDLTSDDVCAYDVLAFG